MSALRAKLKGRVHVLSKEGNRNTRCGRGLGYIVEEGGTGDPVIFDANGSYLLVMIGPELTGVTCHPCRWGSGNKQIKDRGL